MIFHRSYAWCRSQWQQRKHTNFCFDIPFVAGVNATLCTLTIHFFSVSIWYRLLNVFTHIPSESAVFVGNHLNRSALYHNCCWFGCCCKPASHSQNGITDGTDRSFAWFAFDRTYWAIRMSICGRSLWILIRTHEHSHHMYDCLMHSYCIWRNSSRSIVIQLCPHPKLFRWRISRSFKFRVPCSVGRETCLLWKSESPFCFSWQITAIIEFASSRVAHSV